jgi:predicted CopG family antitoxin
MAVRTITVTEEAYRRLRSHKGDSESFSDVLIRLTRRKPVSDLVGIISHETADALRVAIQEDRARRRLLDR